MVDGACLEGMCTVWYRRFESSPLRHFIVPGKGTRYKSTQDAADLLKIKYDARALPEKAVPFLFWHEPLCSLLVLLPATCALPKIFLCCRCILAEWYNELMSRNSCYEMSA